MVIVGGDHADLPLAETDGAALAKLLIVEQVSAVLDLSQLSKSATRRVMADFLETLYRVNRDPLHLIVDEADLLAPQRLPKDMLRLLGAMDDVVRRVRAHGLGVTLISQRHVDCSRLSQDENLTIVELQELMRHASISSTTVYLRPQMAELVEKLQAAPAPTG